MGRSTVIFLISCLLLIATLEVSECGDMNSSKLPRWLTLKGLFPDSSYLAYSSGVIYDLPNSISWCNVQLTRDGAGICYPGLTLDVTSNASMVFKGRDKTHVIDGVSRKAFFTSDFTLHELSTLSLRQGHKGRSSRFDSSDQRILMVENVTNIVKQARLWLNFENVAFFRHQNLSMSSFVFSLSRRFPISYISSPDVNFLRSIEAQNKRSLTKLVFEFRETEALKASTNGSLDLKLIRSFASGIVVSKSLIWPVNDDQYLEPHTSVVQDAHSERLEVFASGFANDDFLLPLNYSFDPVEEYLSFISNGNFSVDGVISDFPITASEAISFFASVDKNEEPRAKQVVISYEGATGEYPASTNLAYIQAIFDGADFIDCQVQMSKDGVIFCLGSINVMERTFRWEIPDMENLTRSIPELGIENGIFTFDLSWSQIQNLTATTLNPFFGFYRNSIHRRLGKIIELSEFLDLTKLSHSLTGVLIKIENAAYLAEKQGLSIVDAVNQVLEKSDYNSDIPRKKVLIQSTDSSVLRDFKKKSDFQLVYHITEIIVDFQDVAIMGITEFANSVTVSKESVFQTSDRFITGVTCVVQRLQAYNLQVFVEVFNNEYVSQTRDCFSDPYIELNVFAHHNISGFVTSFPMTAGRYRRSHCLGKSGLNSYLLPEPGNLLSFMIPRDIPWTENNGSVLSYNQADEPPLPPVVYAPPPATPTIAAAPRHQHFAIFIVMLDIMLNVLVHY